MPEPLQAIDCFEQVIKLDPSHWEAFWTLGRLCMSLNQWQQAIEHLTRAANGMNNSSELWNDLGIAWDKLGNTAQAVIAFEQAISLNTNFEQAHNHLGSVLHGIQEYDDALHQFELAVSIKPGYRAAHVNKAFTLLLNGHLTEGFQSYENRHAQGDLQPPWLSPNKPAWTGRPHMDGRKLLVYAE